MMALSDLSCDETMTDGLSAHQQYQIFITRYLSSKESVLRAVSLDRESEITGTNGQRLAKVWMKKGLGWSSCSEPPSDDTGKRVVIALYEKCIRELESVLKLNVNGLSPAKRDEVHQHREAVSNHLRSARSRLLKLQGGLPAEKRFSTVLITQGPPLEIPVRSVVPSTSEQFSKESEESDTASNGIAAEDLCQDEEIERRHLHQQRSIDTNEKSGYSIREGVIDVVVLSTSEVPGSEYNGAFEEALILSPPSSSGVSSFNDPIKGHLLYGQPGSGTIRLARQVAADSESSVFLNISDISLSSKWDGTLQRMVAANFMFPPNQHLSAIYVDGIEFVVLGCCGIKSEVKAEGLMLKSQTIIRKRRPKGSGKTLTEILDHYPSTSVHSREHSALSNDTSSLSELLCSASSYSQPVSTVPKKITRDSTIYLQSFAWNDTSNSKKMISTTSDMSTEESARVPKEDLSAVDSAQATSAAANAPSSLSEEVNVVFNSQVDHIHADEMATLANVFATTPEIPCHLCGSKMKLTMRKMRYKDAFKEYPGYRCCKKGCQTFRSPRSLLKSYTILVNQMKGQATENYYIPSPLQIKQLEVAFPGEVTSSLEPEESSTEIDAPLSPCTSSKESDERALQLMFPDEQSDDEYDDLKCQLDFVNPKQRCFDKLKAIASESSAKGLQKKSRCDSGLPTGHSQFCGTSVASKVLSPPPSLMRESQETTDGSSISKESSDIPATNGKVISSSPYKKKSQSHLVKGERRRAATLNSSEESFSDECIRKVPKDGSVSPPPLKKWNFRDRAGGEDEEATNDPDHDCEEAKLAIADEDEVSLKDPSLALIIDESASSPPVQKGRDPGRIILHCSEEMIL